MNGVPGFSAPPAALSAASLSLGEQLAYDLLGPVMLRYVMLLDAHIRYAARSGARVLFMSRAGVRIRRLYGRYLDARDLTPPDGCEWFWASRCLAAKAAWNPVPQASLAVFHDEFRHLSIRDACAALLADGSAAVDAGDDAGLDRPGRDLGEFLGTGHPLAGAVVEHLRTQGELFAAYLEALRAPSGRFMLVDSGWRGTTQALLACAFPQYEWAGLYFGRMPLPLPSPLAGRPLEASALVFESARFDPAMPASAFVLYRHLVEGLLQPHGASIEYLGRPDRDGHWAPGAAALLAEAPLAPADYLFRAVHDHVGVAAAAQSLAQIDEAGVRAMQGLAQILAFPTREQALALGGLVSSVDFGRTTLVPVLIDAAGDAGREQRVTQSLWPQGQVAIEYPAAERPARQARRIGLSPAQVSTEPRPRLRRRLSAPAVLQDAAEVVVLVGASSSRAALLRALTGIGAQAFDDYLCIVMVQEADPGPVIEVCEQAPIDPRRLLVAGREPAEVRSRYVAMHDDRGAWHADFLRRTVEFLDADRTSVRQCVVTGVSAADGSAVLRSAVLVPAIACLVRREACAAVHAAGWPAGRLPASAYRQRSLRAIGMGRIRDTLATWHAPAPAGDPADEDPRSRAALYRDYLENHFDSAAAEIR